MAKEKPTDPDKAARKAAKADKKSKRSETDGVHKSSSASKKDSKNEKATPAAAAADAENIDATTKLLNKLADEAPGTVVVKDAKTGEVEMKAKTAPILGALVPFAHPLAEEKVCKKVLKSVKKGIYPPLLPPSLFPLPLANSSQSLPPTKLTPHLPPHSRQNQKPQTRRQRSRQIPAQIRPPHHRRLHHWRRDPRRRYLAYGCHIAHPGLVRGSRGAVYIRSVAGGARGGGEHEEAY